MLKVAVLGSGGIIGQHLQISVPEGVNALFVRKTPSPAGLARGIDANDWDGEFQEMLYDFQPNAIINLMGESRTDVVEKCPQNYAWINVGLPLKLAQWCDRNHSHLIQVSSQAVFAGDHAPYKPSDALGEAVNHYGRQKRFAEHGVSTCDHWTIVRPTFVLGIRPFPALGRENPAEAILGKRQSWAVIDRFFSISFAWDVAEMLWKTAQLRPEGKIIHCGNPEWLSRYKLARTLEPEGDFWPVLHDDLSLQIGPLAQRPHNTTYQDAYYETPLDLGMEMLRERWEDRVEDSLPHRARELAGFLKRPAAGVYTRLMAGFGELHNAVTDDFRANCKGTTDQALIDWYHSTDAYLWELTAYHCDEGFGYDRTCKGILTRLAGERQQRLDRGEMADPFRVLCLGDGVGTLTLRAYQAGFHPTYHDLYDSRTAQFALTRFRMRLQQPIPNYLSGTFDPGKFGLNYDAVVSLDFLEHVPCVEDWVRAVWDALRPGGLFCAQSAFGIGSGTKGSMPMHLECNDRFEKDWDPLLAKIGFVQESSNWYRKGN